VKIEIEEKLQLLVGKQLSRSTRAADMECMKFGILNKEFEGELLNIGEYGLHLQSPWRIVRNDKIVIGSMDLSWEVRGGRNLRDLNMKILTTKSLTVTSISADNFGGFTLHFENNVVLEVIPCLSSKSEHAEYWRLLDNVNNGHLVVGGDGLYNTPEKDNHQDKEKSE